MSLHPDHPDAAAKAGDERESLGRTWTFGRNQFSEYWRAGPKDGTVNCDRNYPANGSGNPYVANGMACKDFDTAAERSRAFAKSEYQRAKAIVDRYEADA